MKKDIEIITKLRNNSRKSITEISKELQMPVSSVFHRIKLQEKKNMIKKHTTLVNFQRLGYNTWMQILIAIDKQDRKRLIEYAINSKNVNSLFEINHGYDIMLETIHKNGKELKDFMEEMRSRFDIKKFKVIEIIQDLKRERFLT